MFTMIVVFMTTWSNGAASVEISDEVYSKSYKGAQEACQVLGNRWLRDREKQKKDHRSYSYRCDLELKKAN